MENAVGRGPTPDADEARAALNAVADDRRRMATVIRRAARWYAPTYGVIIGGIILAPAVPVGAFLPVVLTALLALAALATVYWLRTGMWPRPGTPAQVLAMVLIGALVATGMILAWAAWQVWAIPGLGVGIAVTVGTAAGALSWAFDDASARILESP